MIDNIAIIRKSLRHFFEFDDSISDEDLSSKAEKELKELKSILAELRKVIREKELKI